MTTSYIKYNGEVTLKIKSKPPIKSKNEGKSPLFAALCAFLARTEIDIQELYSNTPASIDIYTVDGEEVLNTPIAIQSRTVSDNSVSLSGSLMSTMLSTHATVGLTKYIVKLTAVNKNIVYATSTIEADLTSLIDTLSSQATITWKLSFGNAVEKTAEST